MQLNFPKARPTGFLFHNTASPNSMPNVRAALPLFLSNEVLPSLPTSNLLVSTAAYSTNHGTTECRAPMLTPHRSSTALFSTLACCSTPRIARSTMPLLALLPTGLCSMT